MSTDKDTAHRVTGEVAGQVTGTVTEDDRDAVPQGGATAPGFGDGYNRESEDERAAGTGVHPDTDENMQDMTPEERELATPVAAVPASVNLDDVEPVEGFRLPRDQPEAEDARLMAERERNDAAYPDTAQRIAAEAQSHADKAAEHARMAQERADQIKDAYKGPDRPPLDEGWRYKKPESDVHDPVE